MSKRTDEHRVCSCSPPHEGMNGRPVGKYRCMCSVGPVSLFRSSCSATATANRGLVDSGWLDIRNPLPWPRSLFSWAPPAAHLPFDSRSRLTCGQEWKEWKEWMDYSLSKLKPSFTPMRRSQCSIRTRIPCKQTTAHTILRTHTLTHTQTYTSIHAPWPNALPTNPSPSSTLRPNSQRDPPNQSQTPTCLESLCLHFSQCKPFCNSVSS